AVRVHPAPPRAQDIHVLLAATPRRQCAAHPICWFGASVPMAIRFQRLSTSDDRSRDRQRPRAVPGRGLRIAAHGCAAAASQPWMADRGGEQPPDRDGLVPQAGNLDISGFPRLEREPKSCRAALYRQPLRQPACTRPAEPRTTGGSMPAADFHPPRRDWRGVVLAAIALMLTAVTASPSVHAQGTQTLESIAEAAIAALGAGDAQSAEAVLAPSLRL